MPIRPELALALDKPQPVDILGTAGQVLTLKNLVDQGRMGAMQLEQAERENAKRQSIADLARASGGDMGKFLEGYQRLAPLEAMELRQRHQKSDLEMRKLQLDETEKRMGIAGRIFAALGPDPTPGQIMDGVSQAISMGSMKSFDGVPDPFTNPGGLKQWYQAKRRSFMDVKDQIEAERKALSDARDASKPMSNVGKLLYDEELVRRNGGTFMPRQPVGGASGAADMTVAPKKISGEPMENILLTAARNEALGSPDQLFEWSPDGKRVLRQDVLSAQKELRKSGATNVQQFNNTKDDFKNERDLRNDLKSEPIYKAYQEIKVAYGQIGRSLKLASPAGDLAAATQIRKLLDPTSVVRETELQQVIEATGLGDRLSNYVQNIISGNKLTPKQREDFRSLADQLYGESEKAFRAKTKEYGDIASEYGLNPRRVGGPGEQREFDQMPDPKEFSGRQIQAPDGTVYKSDGKRWIREKK